jgi:hypothetical protein
MHHDHTYSPAHNASASTDRKGNMSLCTSSKPLARRAQQHAVQTIALQLQQGSVVRLTSCTLMVRKIYYTSMHHLAGAADAATLSRHLKQTSQCSRATSINSQRMHRALSCVGQCTSEHSIWFWQ